MTKQEKKDVKILLYYLTEYMETFQVNSINLYSEKDDIKMFNRINKIRIKYNLK